MIELRPGRELDALIAQMVFDWPRETHLIGNGVDDPIRYDKDYAVYEVRPAELNGRPVPHPGRRISDRVPCYSTDWNAAKLVIEQLRRKHNLYWRCTVGWIDGYGAWAYFDQQGTTDTHPAYDGHGIDLPEATCYAAVKAVRDIALTELARISQEMGELD